MVQVGGVLGFHVNEELIFPGAAVNGPAFDFEQIYSVFRKRLEGGGQRTWTMCEAHGERRFPGFTCEPRGRLFFRYQKDEAREVFSIILDMFGKNDAMIML